MSRFIVGVALGLMLATGFTWAQSTVADVVTVPGYLPVDAECRGMDEALAILSELRDRPTMVFGTPEPGPGFTTMPWIEQR